MREDDGGTRRPGCEIVLQPVELFGTETSPAARLQVEHVDQTDEMNPCCIKAVPAAPLPGIGRTETRIEGGTRIVADDIVFAGDDVHRRPQGAQHVLGDCELGGLRKVGYVAGMKDERRLRVEGVDPFEGEPQRRCDVGVGLLVETDMGVADLYKCQAGILRGLDAGGIAQSKQPGECRSRPSTGHRCRPTPCISAPPAGQLRMKSCDAPCLLFTWMSPGKTGRSGYFFPLFFRSPRE